MLIAGVDGIETGFYMATGLTAVQVVHYFSREKSISAFPVQVRIGYLLLLVTAQLPYMLWIYWIQIAGTTAMVLFGYCPLARILSLMPWNRTQSFTFDLVKRTVFAPPVEGNILQGLPAK